MAGDWIKMRASLMTSRKVFVIAKRLRACKDYHEWLMPGHGEHAVHVSEYVTRCVTVASLLRVWSVAREHGRLAEGDLVLEQIDLADVDSIAGVTGFAAAMRDVGWLREMPDGGGVLLPNFNEYNVLPPSQAKPMTPAERKARQRQRQKEQRVCHADRDISRDVSRDKSHEKVTNVTAEERRGEERHRGKNSPMTPSCSETQSVSEPPPAEGEKSLLTFPTDGPVKEWRLTQGHLDEMIAAYPALDVMAECRKALLWVKAKPERRKTARGMRAFLLGWLGKSQDRGPRSPLGGQPGSRPDFFQGLHDFVDGKPLGDAGPGQEGRG